MATERRVPGLGEAQLLRPHAVSSGLASKLGPGDPARRASGSQLRPHSRASRLPCPGPSASRGIFVSLREGMGSSGDWGGAFGDKITLSCHLHSSYQNESHLGADKVLDPPSPPGGSPLLSRAPPVLR